VVKLRNPLVMGQGGGDWPKWGGNTKARKEAGLHTRDQPVQERGVVLHELEQAISNKHNQEREEWSGGERRKKKIKGEKECTGERGHTHVAAASQDQKKQRKKTGFSRSKWSNEKWGLGKGINLPIGGLAVLKTGGG